MPETLTQGTVEYLILDLVDLVGDMTTLTGTNPTFEVRNATNVTVQTGSVSTIGMSAYCLINTTTGAPQNPWPGGDYRLYITFTTNPEQPRLGPFTFTVDAT